MKDKILEVAQSVLAMVGGILVASGVISDIMATAIVGGVIGISAAVWSLIVHIKNSKEIHKLEIQNLQTNLELDKLKRDLMVIENSKK